MGRTCGPVSVFPLYRKDNHGRIYFRSWNLLPLYPLPTQATLTAKPALFMNAGERPQQQALQEILSCSLCDVKTLYPCLE